ncbi:MAG: InlB B-repeat-containing protein, partial [Clostridia bacterium]|nr:InlB B-repeat-containing protein [Clostridia bacterium]
MVKKNEKIEKKNNSNSIKGSVDKKVNTKKVVGKNVDTNSTEVSKLIKAIKTNDAKAPVLKPKKKMRTKVAIISSATVAVAGAGIGVGAYVANQDKEYVITMYYQGGVENEMKANKVGDLKAPEVPGYTFVGWYRDPSYDKLYKPSTKFEDDCVVYGKYAPIAYDIEFVNENNSLCERISVLYDSSISFPEKPTIQKEGYKFVGWALNRNETDSSKIYYHGQENLRTLKETENLTFYPIWAIDTFTLTIEYPEGVFGGASTKTKQVVYGNTIQGEFDWNVKYDDFSKYFVGYQVDGVLYKDPNKPINMPAKNIVAKPIFEFSKVNVRLELNGAGAQADGFVTNYKLSYDPEIQEEGYSYLSASLNAPTKENYTFMGWSYTLNGEVLTKEIFTLIPTEHKNGENVILYAVWEANEYDIEVKVENIDFGTVQLNGEEWDPLSNNKIAASYGESIIVNKTSISIGDKTIVLTPKTNNFKANYSVSVEAPEKCEKDKSITIKFTRTYNEYTAILNINSDDEQSNDFIPSYKLTYDESKDNYDEIFNIPTKTGHTFLGWSLENDSTVDEGLKVETDDQGNILDLHYMLPTTQKDFEALNVDKDGKFNLYAVWEVNEYPNDIIYSGVDGGKLRNANDEIVNSITAKYGEKVVVDNKNDKVIVGDQEYIVKFNSIVGEIYDVTITVDGGTAQTEWKDGTRIELNFTRKYLNLSVVLDLLGGTAEKSQYNMSYDPANNNKSILLNAPTKTGYTFLGWSVDKSSTTAEFSGLQNFTLPDNKEEYDDLGVVVNPNNNAEGTLKLYAIWQANDVDIQLNIVNPTYGSVKLNGENVSAVNAKHDENISISGNIITIGQQIVEVTANEETKEAIYSIVKIESSQNKCAEGVVITIEFAREYKDYIITLDTNSNKEATIDKTSYTIGYDDGAIALNTPERTGYKFIGWGKSPTIQYRQLDTNEVPNYLDCLYKKDEYDYYYKVEIDPMVGYSPSQIFYTLDLDYPYSGSDVQFALTNETENFTLYALWEIEEYTINIDFQNKDIVTLINWDTNEEVTSIKATYGDKIELSGAKNLLSIDNGTKLFEAKLKRNNFGENYNFEIKVNTTKWTKDTKIEVVFTVEYTNLTLNLDLNGAGEQTEGFKTSYAMSYDPAQSNKAITLNTPTREHYVFRGWSKTATPTYTQAEITEENFAMYQEDLYTTTWMYPSYIDSEYVRVYFESYQEYLSSGKTVYIRDISHRYNNSDIEYTLIDEASNFTLYAMWELELHDFTIEYNVTEGNSISGDVAPQLETITTKLPYGSRYDMCPIGSWGFETDALNWIFTNNFVSSKLVKLTWGGYEEPGIENFNTKTQIGFGTTNKFGGEFVEDFYGFEVWQHSTNGQTWQNHSPQDIGNVILNSDLYIRFNIKVVENPNAYSYNLSMSSKGYYGNPVGRITESFGTDFSGWDKVIFPTAEEAVTNNYNFIGWTLTDGKKTIDLEAGKEYTIAELRAIYEANNAYSGATLYPVWEAKSYNVTITRDGKDDDQVSHDYIGADRISSVKYGTEYTLPVDLECKDAGFFVSGYIVDGVTKKPGDSIVIEGNITIAPVWGDKYAISFVVSNSYISGIDNDPVLLTPDVNAGGVVTTTLDAIAPTFADPDNRFTFLGWSESSHNYVENESDASGWLISSTTEINFTQSKTYYAVWQVNKVTYTVNTIFKDGKQAVDAQLYPQTSNTFTTTAIDTINVYYYSTRVSIGGNEQEFYEVIYDSELSAADMVLRDYYEVTYEIQGSNINLTYEAKVMDHFITFANSGELYEGNPTMENIPEYIKFSGFDPIVLPEVEDSTGNYEFKGWAYQKWEYNGFGSPELQPIPTEVDFLAGKNLTWDEIRWIYSSIYAFTGSTDLSQVFYPVWEIKTYTANAEIEYLNETQDSTVTKTSVYGSNIAFTGFNSFAYSSWGDAVEQGYSVMRNDSDGDDEFTVVLVSTWSPTKDEYYISKIMYKSSTDTDWIEMVEGVEYSFDSDVQFKFVADVREKEYTITFAETIDEYDGNPTMTVKPNDITIGGYDELDLPMVTDSTGKYKLAGWKYDSTPKTLPTYKTISVEDMENMSFDDWKVLFENLFGTSMDGSGFGSAVLYPVWEEIAYNVQFSVVTKGNSTIGMNSAPLSGQTAPTLAQSEFSLPVSGTIQWYNLSAWYECAQVGIDIVGDDKTTLKIGFNDDEVLATMQDYYKCKSLEYSTDNGLTWNTLGKGSKLTITADTKVRINFEVAPGENYLNFIDRDMNGVGYDLFGYPTIDCAGTVDFDGYDSYELPSAVDTKGNYNFMGWDDDYGNTYSAGQVVTWNTFTDLNYQDSAKGGWGIRLIPIWEAKEVELEIEVEMREDGSGSIVTGENWGNVYFDGQVVNPGDKITVKFGDIIVDPTNNVLDIAGKQLRFERTFDNDYANIQLNTYDISSLEEYTDDYTGECTLRVGGSGKITVNLIRSWSNISLDYAMTYGADMEADEVSGLNSTSVESSWINIRNMTLPELTYTDDPEADDCGLIFTDQVEFVGWATSKQNKSGDAYTLNQDVFTDGRIIEHASFTGTIYPVWNYKYIEKEILSHGDYDESKIGQYSTDGGKTWQEIGQFTTLQVRCGDKIEVYANEFLYGCEGIINKPSTDDFTITYNLYDQFSGELSYSCIFKVDSNINKENGTIKKLVFNTNNYTSFVHVDSQNLIDIIETNIERHVTFVGYNDGNPVEKTFGSISVPNMSKEHYNFLGWSVKADKSGDLVQAGSNLSIDNLTIFPEAIWPEDINENSYIEIKLYPVWQAHKYTLEYSYTAGALDSSYDKSNLASVEVEYAPGKVIELVSPTYGKGYTFEGWWMPDASSMGTTFALDDYLEGLADGDLLMVTENVCRDISLSIDATLSPQEIELGEVIFAGSENSVSTYLHHSSGGNILFDFTQGYDDVRYDMGVAFGLPGVRQNYTL